MLIQGIITLPYVALVFPVFYKRKYRYILTGIQFPKASVIKISFTRINL
jgi:hypothetical protein